MTQDQVSAEYFNAALQRLIDKCEQATFMLAQNGSVPDLSDMNTDIEKLCQAIQTSEPVVARATELKMARLIGSLEKLTTGLHDYKAKFTNEN